MINTEIKNAVKFKNPEIICPPEEIYRLAEIGKISCELLHDLINPITGLALYLDTIKSAGLNVNILEQFLDPLNNTSATIRDFIRMIQNNLNEGDSFKIINVESIMSDVIQILECKALNKKVSFMMTKNTVRTLVVGNSLKMYQAIINLISNAVDSYDSISDNRKKQINTIIEEDSDKAAPQLVIKISDNGSGISKNKMMEVFSPIPSEKKNGVGIGLTHTKNIIENHFEGKITAESDGKNFTNFIIKIPFSRRVDF